MKIKNFRASSSFAEIFQQTSIKFAYAKPSGKGYIEQQHGFVDCRDFLGDVLWLEQQKKKGCIYSFCWDPAKEQIARDKTYLLIKFPNKGYIHTFLSNLDYLNNYEKTWHFTPTKVQTTDRENVLLLTGSKMYLRKIWLISLYTYLIKAYSITSNFDDLSGNEGTYFNQVGKTNFWNLMNNLRKFMKIGNKVTDEHEDLHSIHYQSGFVAMCKNNLYPMQKKFKKELTK